MTVDYSGNPNQRTPCVLVLDASGSMLTAGPSGRTRIDELNEGLRTLEQALKSDDSAISRVQLSIVLVGGPNNRAELLMDWTDVESFTAFPVTADGTTPLGEGLQIALDVIEQGKQTLRTAGVNYTRPWMMVITDGLPTDSPSVWASAVQACRAAEGAKKVEIFTIGVEGVELNMLSQISSRPPALLEGLKFQEMFLWLSSSLSAASRSRPGDTINVPSPKTWANVGM